MSTGQEQLLQTFGIDAIAATAEWFWQQTNARVFAFHGDMGVGKTTFIGMLCRSKGVATQVSSPTFSLINEYIYVEDGVEKTIYHMDMYRLKDEEEAIQAGVEDCLYSGSICLVEWPEKIASIFPDDTVHVYLSLAKDGERTLRLLANR